MLNYSPAKTNKKHILIIWEMIGITDRTPQFGC